jgi:hypothetical protein
MIGRQREPRRAHLEGQMARLIQPVDKFGLCQVRMLTGDSEARHYKVHIMDIAHPDVDGVMERLFEEAKGKDAAEEFFDKGGPETYTVAAIAKAAEEQLSRAFYEQGGGTLPSEFLVGPWKQTMAKWRLGYTSTLQVPNVWVIANLGLETERKRAAQRRRVEAETRKQQDKEREQQKKQTQAGRKKRGKAQQGEIAEKLRSIDTWGVVFEKAK